MSKSFNFKNEVLESYYISKNAKNYMLSVLKNRVTKEVLQDFDINFEWYKLKNNSLIINNAIVYTFKYKKQFNEVAKNVNFLNTIEHFKDYENITIFSDFSHFTKNGIGIYKIKIFASYPKQNRILNITCDVAKLRACKGYNAIMHEDCLHGYDMDMIYIKKFLEENNIKCFK